MLNLKVCCLGAGFVGLPTSSVLATHNPDSKFVVYDVDAKRIQMCNSGVVPIYQPKLQDTMNRVLGKNLFFTSTIKEALLDTSVIFIAVPTPTKLFGFEKGKGYDLSYTENAIRSIVNFYNSNPIKEQVIIVEKSTVPVGTAQMITDIINNVSIPENRSKYVITSNPEFLAEGSAIDDFNHPERVVIGSNTSDNISNLTKLYHYVDQSRLILTNRFSSQLSKLTSNCFLAQRVSSINSISLLCQEVGADIKEIKKCIEKDTRIGSKFLNSSVGFGGSCFRKDILALVYLAECKGLQEVADYWRAVITMNDYRQIRFFKNIFSQMNNNLVGKKIAIFGIAFKKDTCDARDSPSLKICHHLLSQGAELNIFDPKTTIHSFKREMEYNHLWSEQFNTKITEFNDPSEAAMKTHAIVLLTEWDIFQSCDYQSFYQNMQKPAYIFDGRNILDEQQIIKIGFRYSRIGKKNEPLY